MEVSQEKNRSISVIMCTYNGEKFIKTQLKTILEQTYPIEEILIFDDVSTDNTVNIIKEIASSNPIISLTINKTNIGYNKNFEKGFLAASGDVIAVADQDDIWLPNKIEKMVLAWKPGIPFIYCYSCLFNEGSLTKGKMNRRIRRFEGTDARKLFMYNTVSGHTILFEKKLLKFALPFPKNVIYDWWLPVVACYNGGVQHLPEILVYQRIHENNSTIFRDKHKFTKHQLKTRFVEAVVNGCTEFAKLPFMPQDHKELALKLVNLFRESQNHLFYRPLFYFLLKYRNLLFNNKRRFIPIITQVKNSYRLAKAIVD